MTRPTNAMVEAVKAELLRPVDDCAGPGRDQDELAIALITAMLDNLPREVMVEAMNTAFWGDLTDRGMLDAAILAARKEIQGHD